MYLKQPASRSFLCRTWRIYDFVHSNKFQAGTRTVTICHLLVAVLYLLLWSFSLFIFKKYWFPLQSKNNTSQYLCSAAKAVKDESTASWYLGVLTGILEAGASRRRYLPEFFSKSAIPPWGLNREVFCLWMFSLFYFYKEMRKIRSFPVAFFTAVLAARAGTGWR